MSKLLLSLFVVLFALTGCATSKDQAATAAPSAGTLASPISLTNCERDLRFERSPQRIISLSPYATEVLIRLGAGDRIIGRAGWTPGNTAPLPEVAEQFNKIPQLSEKYPTAEQLFDLQPDLIVSGYSSAFNEKDGRSRQQFADRGVPTFLFSEYCGKDLASLDVLTNDFRQLGQLLGHPDKADTLINEISGGLDAVKTRLAGVPAVPTFFFDGGEKEPTSVGGTGIGHLIATTAGAKNLTSDLKRPYAKASWEKVAEAAPEVIVVLNYDGMSAEEKVNLLKNQPLMKSTPAIRDNRIIVLELADFFESPRLVRATQQLAAGLHPSRFA